jgi:hypothetical protein
VHARAAASTATAERILDAAVEVSRDLPTDQISLEEVARRARVTVQTVIRRFGGRNGLLAAPQSASPIRSGGNPRRRQSATWLVPRTCWSSNYEAYGDRVFKMLAEEESVPGLREIADRGRALHGEWCAEVFAPSLSTLKELDRTRGQGDRRQVPTVRYRTA